jgi:hypothetical protein
MNAEIFSHPCQTVVTAASTGCVDLTRLDFSDQQDPPGLGRQFGGR